jgi:glycosyltransferase involved in cell wall biosynthesis
MPPEISVILPVYNGQQFIRSSIESILNQTFGNFELIIINDGSTDQTAELLKIFNDPRLTIIDNVINQGLIYSLNIGLQNTRGDFIARMDADDISEPLRFQKQYEFLKQNPKVGIVGSQVRFFDCELKKEIFFKDYPQSHGEIAWGMIFNCCIAHPSIMAKKEVFENNGSYMQGWDTVEDYELWTRLIPTTQFANLNEPLLNYRVHNQSISRQKKEFQRKQTLAVRARYISSLTNVDVNERIIDLLDHFADASEFEKDKIIDLINFLFSIFIERKWLIGNETNLENSSLIHRDQGTQRNQRKAEIEKNDPTQFDFSNTPVSNKRPTYFYKPIEITEKPTVTIVTPFYNTIQVFHETALSVLRQSFQQWEWIIVNDGSTNETSLTLLNQYRNIDVRIKVVDQMDNYGPSAARNKGYSLAQTKYVVQLDSDDLLEPTAIEKWYWFMETHPEYSFAKGYCIGFSAMEYLYEGGFHQNERFLVENCVDLNCIIKKSVHDIVGGYDESNKLGLEDWDFWMHCAAHGFWGATIPEYHDWYRRSKNYTEKWPNWNLEKMGEFVEILRERYPSLWAREFPSITSPVDRPIHLDVEDSIAKNKLTKEKKRLLLILPWLKIGGADKFNLDLLTQLSLHEWEISIITVLEGENSWYKEFEKFTPDIFILNHFLPKEDYPRFINYFLGSRNFDVVISTMNVFGYQILPYIRANYPDICIIDILHMEEENGDFGAYPAISVTNQMFIDFHLTTTKHLMNRMIEHGLDQNRVGVCYTNIETKGWKTKEKERKRICTDLRIRDNFPWIIYVARLCKQKQPRVLGKTLKILKDEGLDFYALVIGDGPDREMLQLFINQNGLESQVLMLGALDNQSTKEMIRASDVLFLPSLWEGLALTIYEAMAAGLPIVGADVSGQKELVTEDCGYLLPRSNEDSEAKEYAKVLKILIGNPELRSQMGRNSHKRVAKHFRLDQLGPRLVELITKAIELHENKPLASVTLTQGISAAELAVQYAKEHPTWVEPKTEYDLQPISAKEENIKTDEAEPPQTGTKVRLYRFIKKFLLPFYIYAKQKNIKVVTDFRYRLRKSLISDEDSYNAVYAFNDPPLLSKSHNMPKNMVQKIVEKKTEQSANVFLEEIHAQDVKVIQQLKAGNLYLEEIHKKDVDAIQELRVGNEWLDSMRIKDIAFIAELKHKIYLQSQEIEAYRLLLKNHWFIQFIGVIKLFLVKLFAKLSVLKKF